MTTTAGKRGRWFLPLLVVAAVLLFAAIYSHQRSMEATVVRRVLVSDAVAGPPRPLADVAKAVRSMKLVTVEVETEVEAIVTDVSWRGDISAKVSAPAKLLYGTDLAQMDVSAIGFSPLTKTYVVRVPRPTRIATEVWAEQETMELTTGWLRLRSRAGEYYLGLARKSLTDRARNLRLSEDDAEKVSRVTKEQVEALVKQLIGKDADVAVSYVGAPVANGGEDAAGKNAAVEVRIENGKVSP